MSVGRDALARNLPNDVRRDRVAEQVGQLHRERSGESVTVLVHADVLQDCRFSD